MSAISRNALLSISLCSTLLATGTASAAPHPVATGYDSGWKGASFRALDLPAVNNTLAQIKSALTVPVLGQIADVHIGADLHAYMRMWMQPNSIGTRAETTAWMGASVWWPGDGRGGYEWLRVNAEASAYRLTGPMTCPSCTEWTAQGFFELIKNGTKLYSPPQPTSPASVDVPLVQKELAVTPVSATYTVPLGPLGDVALQLTSQTYVRLDGDLHADPISTNLDVVARAHAFIDIYTWTDNPYGQVYFHARLDALGDNVVDANYDGRVDEADNAAMGGRAQATRAQFTASLGTAEYDWATGWRLCPSARADIWEMNPLTGSVYAFAYAKTPWGPVELVNSYTPFSSGVNWHPVVEERPACIPLLHMPF